MMAFGDSVLTGDARFKMGWVVFEKGAAYACGERAIIEEFGGCNAELALQSGMWDANCRS